MNFTKELKCFQENCVVFDLDVIYRLGSIYKEKLVSYFFKGTDEGSISMRLPDIRHDGFPFQINQITKAHSLTDATWW